MKEKGGCWISWRISIRLLCPETALKSWIIQIIIQFALDDWLWEYCSYGESVKLSIMSWICKYRNSVLNMVCLLFRGRANYIGFVLSLIMTVCKSGLDKKLESEERYLMRNRRTLMAQEQGLFQCFGLLLVGGWHPWELGTKE